MGGSGPTGATGPRGPTGPASANYVITAQGTKFYGTAGSQTVYTFTNLDRNILDYAGWYRVTAADLTTSTGPVALAPSFTNYEFVIVPTLNYFTVPPPSISYGGNTIQTLPDSNAIAAYSFGITPAALQPDIGTTDAPNNFINDNSATYNARYNVVLNYTGTRPMLLNWYLYKSNFYMPLAMNLTFYLAHFRVSRFGVTNRHIPLNYNSTLNTITSNVYEDRFILFDTSYPSEDPRESWRVGFVDRASNPPDNNGLYKIPSGTYTRLDIVQRIQAILDRARGLRVETEIGNGEFLIFPRTEVYLHDNRYLVFKTFDDVPADIAIGFIFGGEGNNSPNASTFFGCAHPMQDVNFHGIGGCALLILGPTTGTQTARAALPLCYTAPGGTY
jgi:hypothetical protein